MSNTKNTKETKTFSVRFIAVTAMLSAVAFVLMFFDFSIPIIPSFIKMDVSELPALVAAFALGPVSGVLVCLIKNLIHLAMTTTGGIGEVCNFFLGAAFVLPAGLIYKAKKSKKTALIGAVVGAVVMGLFSIPLNYFLTYPVYYNFMPEEVILGAYQAINPSVKSILQCLIVFNMPFTIVKGFLSAAITMVIYKPLSPILKGRA